MYNVVRSEKSGGQISITDDKEEIFKRILKADAALVCDVSGSMRTQDAGEARDKTRFEVLTDTVRQLLSELKGELVVVGFNMRVSLVMTVLPQPDLGTDMAGALRFLKPGSRFLKKIVLLSDGQPTQGFQKMSPMDAALDAAKQLGCPLDTIYIGPPDKSAEKFMKKLAKAGHGSSENISLTDPALLVRRTKDRLMLADGS